MFEREKVEGWEKGWKNSPKQLRFERDVLWKCLKKYKRIAASASTDPKVLRAANGAVNRGSLYDLCKALKV
jgi:hypothetical protein